MRRERLGGLAMIASVVMGLVTMALHPTGHDVVRDVQRQGGLALAVHALGLTGVPLGLYGALALTRRLGAAGPLAELALAFQGMAAVATLLAATASGLIAPGLIARVTAASADQRAVASAVLHYNGDVNQAFARVLVAASSVAIALWSLEILRTRRLRRGTGVFGIAVALAALAALLSGHLRLDVHGFGAVVLAQGVWLVLVGLELARRESHGGTTPLRSSEPTLPRGSSAPPR
jgi:hypothetical protein